MLMLLGHLGVVTIVIITAIGIVDTGGESAEFL
jgi:hypothetical protein